jgi:ABC-type branched-subunit amino acid transport system ATPase component
VTTVAVEAPLVELRGIHAGYGGIEVLHGVDLAVPAGSVTALLGPNGAGKTTTVRLLLGLIRPTSGTATVGGLPLSGDEQARQALRKSCGFLTEAPGFYDRRTALDNLNFFARLYDLRNPGRAIEHHLREFGLWEHRDKPVGSFSKGMKQRLAIIRALFHEPRVLFLDEPSASSSPGSRPRAGPSWSAPTTSMKRSDSPTGSGFSASGSWRSIRWMVSSAARGRAGRCGSGWARTAGGGMPWSRA